jgi:hypothetical protein
MLFHTKHNTNAVIRDLVKQLLPDEREVVQKVLLVSTIRSGQRIHVIDARLSLVAA